MVPEMHAPVMTDLRTGCNRVVVPLWIYPSPPPPSCPVLPLFLCLILTQISLSSSCISCPVPSSVLLLCRCLSSLSHPAPVCLSVYLSLSLSLPPAPITNIYTFNLMWSDTFPCIPLSSYWITHSGLSQLQTSHTTSHRIYQKGATYSNKRCIHGSGFCITTTQTV